MKKQAIELKDEHGHIYWVIDDSGDKVAAHDKGIWDAREIIGFGGNAWMVLAKSDDDKAALIISLYVLEERPYQGESRKARERFGEYYDDLTWEQSEIREYLNGSFIEKYFCPAEALRIIPTRLRNDDNEATGARGGNETLDKVFLLSLSEADKYLWSCLLKLEKTRARYHWWLRSPAECGAWPAFVMDWSDEPDGEEFPLLCDGDGEHGDGCSVDYGIRPAMCIELEEVDKAER